MRSGSVTEGGYVAKHLQILIRGETPPISVLPEEEDNRTEDGGVNIFPYSAKTQLKFSRDATSNDDHQARRSTPNRSWADEPMYPTPRVWPGFSHQNSLWQDEGSLTPDFEKEDGYLATIRSDRPFYARAEQRTILLKGLSEKTTYKEIVQQLRGGTVLDIFLRSHERSVSVSFVEGSTAQQFLAYTRRNDIYIGRKRVSPETILRQARNTY